MLTVNTLNMHTRYNGLGKSEKKSIVPQGNTLIFAIDIEQLHDISLEHSLLVKLKVTR